jgi:hypothetical protein
MKRCSECHFTFSDNDQVCDFDGTPLSEIREPRAVAPRKSALRRLLQSQGMAVVLVLVGLVMSALLIGYYDALNQANSDAGAGSRAQEVAPDLAKVTAAALPQPKELPNQFGPVRTNNTERPGSAKNKPRLSSRLKRPSTVPHTLSLQSHVVRASAGFRQGNHRAAKRKREQMSPGLLAMNSKRSSYPIATSLHRSSVRAVKGELKEPSVAHHKKDSKLVAALRTTGRILKWPFQF